MSGQTYLTVAEVAEQLAISELTVRRRIATGEIPAVRLSTVGRGAIRVPAGRARPLARTPARPAGRHVHPDPRKERPMTDHRQVLDSIARKEAWSRELSQHVDSHGRIDGAAAAEIRDRHNPPRPDPARQPHPTPRLSGRATAAPAPTSPYPTRPATGSTRCATRSPRPNRSATGPRPCG